MDDTRALRRIEHIAHIDGDLQCFLRIERAATGQPFGDSLLFEILQHKEVNRLS